MDSLPLSRMQCYDRAETRSVFVVAFIAGLKPDRTFTVSEWADENRVLPRVSASEHGRWRTSRTPYLREIMDALSPDDPCTEVTFQKGTQIGGSEAGYNWLGSVIDVWPAPFMLVMPTTDTAKRISKQRLATMIEETPALRGKVADPKARESSNSILLKEFPGGVLVVTGANSGPGLRSMPVRFLMLDEVDAYPSDVDGEGDPCVVAEKRTTNWSRKKIFRCSSPKHKATSRIARYYSASDQRRYFVPCPECASEQSLKWTQMRWLTRKIWEVTSQEDGEVTEVEENSPGSVERDTRDVIDVWYECESCSARIDEHHKTKMLARGRWVATKPGVGRHPGFQLSALYSPVGWFSWRDAVKQFVEAETDTSTELAQVFRNTVLGEAYEEGGDQPDEHMLRKHVEEYRVGETVPAGALLLTCGVDVQGDRLEARVWGFGPEDESWLLAREIIWGSPTLEETWDALEPVLFGEYAHALGGKVRIAATMIDASDGNTTHFVRAFCRKHATRHVLAGKGQAVAGKPIIGRPTPQDVNHRGKLIKGGVKLWPLGSDTAKSVLYARFALKVPGPGYVHLPSGLPDEEFAQMTAERLITHYVKGFPKREWVKQSRVRNEALDCAAMALAAAHYAGLGRLNWERLYNAAARPEHSERGDADGEERKTEIAKPMIHRPRAAGSFATNW